jgi:hypothetical protein
LDLPWVVVRDRRRPPNLSGILPGEALGFPIPGWWPGRHNRLSPDEASVAEFSVAAWRFCASVDELMASTGSERSELIALHPILATLYASAANLPDVGEDEDVSIPFLSYGERDDVLRQLARRIGRFDDYREVFDPWGDQEPDRGSLADDLSDVYAGVKPALVRLGQAERVEATVWGLRFGFFSHWGEHLVGALRAVYFLAREDDTEPD